MYTEARLEGYNEVWSTGQTIISCDISLGAGKGGTTLTLSLADPTGQIASRLVAHTIEQGGIIGAPAEPSAESSEADTSKSPGITPSGGKDIPGPADIIRKCHELGVNDPAQIAYILASADHESGNFKFIEEQGERSYFNYLEGRADLGNTSPGDGYKYRGRGLVQLTGLRNYGVMSKLTGLDLVGKPELAGDPEVSLATLVYGMREGIFTGRKLGQYVSGSKVDFINARRVVNGLDQATKIAAMAEAYLSNMPSASSGPNAGSGATTTSTVSPAAKPESILKGNRLHVSIGDRLFSFYHSSTKTSNEGVTTITGQGVRWVMARRRRSRSFQGLSLSAIVERLAEDNFLGFEYRANHDPSFEHLEQTGLTDYALLQRETEKAGLYLTETDGVLIVDELKNVRDTQLVLTLGRDLIGWNVEDNAISALSDVDKHDTAKLQTEAKAVIDPASGTINQTTPDISTADVPTGEAAPAVSGVQTPESAAVSADSRGKMKRVKGLPSQLVIPLTTASLSIGPLTAVRTAGLPAAFSRVWLVDNVAHSVSNGTSTLGVYSPVEVLDLTPEPESAGGASPGIQANAGGTWIWPMKGIITSVPGPRNGRTHAGYDISNGLANTPIVAMKEGVVKVAFLGCSAFGGSVGSRCGAPGYGGYGNAVVIDHGGAISLYTHMSKTTVRVGDTVSQGQKVGEEGSSGSSTGPHIHAEVRINGRAVLNWHELGLGSPGQHTNVAP